MPNRRADGNRGYRKKKVELKPFAVEAAQVSPTAQTVVQPATTATQSPTVLATNQQKNFSTPGVKSISISAMKPASTQESPSAETAPSSGETVNFGNADFSDEEFFLAWEKYADNVQNSSALVSATMKNFRPERVSGAEFLLSVPNPMQKKDIEGEAQLLPFLRNELKNSQISLKIEISKVSKAMIISTDECWENLLKTDENVRLLQEKLKLELD